MEWRWRYMLEFKPRKIWELPISDWRNKVGAVECEIQQERCFFCALVKFGGTTGYSFYTSAIRVCKWGKAQQMGGGGAMNRSATNPEEKFFANLDNASRKKNGPAHRTQRLTLLPNRALRGSVLRLSHVQTKTGNLTIRISAWNANYSAIATTTP